MAWSGGKDSTVVADLVSRTWPGTPLVHFDSGFDFPETADYMTTIAADRGWRYEPISVGSALDAMVANGTWDQQAEADPEALGWWDVICAGPATEASRRYAPCMAWGLRADESARRRMCMAGQGLSHSRADGVRVLSPIGWWTAADVWAYHDAAGLRPNPIYVRLAELGVPEHGRRVSLLVGSDGLGWGRAMWLRRGWPDIWQELVRALPRLKEFS